MAMDGVEPKVLRDTMELEISNLEEEAEQPIKFWQAAGGYAPTIGILGAVLGLIHVDGKPERSKQAWRRHCTAFVATVYGLVTANIIYLPMARKAQAQVKIAYGR